MLGWFRRWWNADDIDDVKVVRGIRPLNTVTPRPTAPVVNRPLVAAQEQYAAAHYVHPRRQEQNDEARRRSDEDGVPSPFLSSAAVEVMSMIESSSSSDSSPSVDSSPSFDSGFSGGDSGGGGGGDSF